MDFQVDLDIYRGPLDLLLHLVRKHEVEITDIPIHTIAEQYLEHLEVLKELDVDSVGEFIELASTLVEIKSRLVLPAPESPEEQIEDPREELVQRLLEYKRYRDAASILDEQSRQWQRRFARVANDVPPRPLDLGNQAIQEIELWDLVSAFGRVLRDHQVETGSNIVYDDTPIHVHMQRIRDQLQQQQQVRISELFEPGMHKMAMIGVFLAVLELVRHHSIDTHQDDGHGEIVIVPGSRLHDPIELTTSFRESSTPDAIDEESAANESGAERDSTNGSTDDSSGKAQAAE
ncbi:MAG: segregation/condensation protein A [Planctomycetales bacterium]|nr:segregation/condensation protein A [Planctomycetales bacterium]